MSTSRSYDGLQDRIRQLETPGIETWTNEYGDRDYTIDITNLEFTAICPKTGLPDFATIRVTYVPDERCVELKSLKEYFLSFRDIGIFHEHVVNKVLDDFVAACRPRKVEVVGEFNIRGGLKTVVRASYSEERDDR
ncbi:MAG: preQ(1) synthase [Candidatus Poribacteria bacterium]|nr:preQ(1) synthase [Candidatus Poribacteria bacterium]MDE0504944.1 preQ(1) synthase [Candidatus Poribacteria bacterium]